MSCLLPRGAGQHQAFAAGVDDDRHVVVLAEFARELLQAVDHERQLGRFVHRAGDIDQKHEVRLWPLVAVHLAAFDGDAGEPMLGVQGQPATSTWAAKAESACLTYAWPSGVWVRRGELAA